MDAGWNRARGQALGKGHGRPAPDGSTVPEAGKARVRCTLGFAGHLRDARRAAPIPIAAACRRPLDLRQVSVKIHVAKRAAFKCPDCLEDIAAVTTIRASPSGFFGGRLG